MNTATAYFARSAAAYTAAHDLASDPAPRTRQHAVRAFRLAEYAARCAELTAAAAGPGDSLALGAYGYADDAEQAASDVQARRRVLSRVRVAVLASSRTGLDAALTAVLESRAAEAGEQRMAERAYVRLAVLPVGRPAVHALSWPLARHLGLPEEEVVALAH